MKRSEINRAIQEAMDIFSIHGWKLPPFAYFAPEQWAQAGSEYDILRGCMLGWDVTDFGSGDYKNTGLLLFTLRNGNLKDPENKKTYAEKLMLVKENQNTPFHFHWSKMEDIINRGGGNLMVQVYNADKDEQIAATPVEVLMDGCKKVFPAGSVLTIHPGESITMSPYLYHRFWGEPGGGPVVVGEVSQVNDDNTDNRFAEKRDRFLKIEEDVPPEYLLCNEYPAAR